MMANTICQLRPVMDHISMVKWQSRWCKKSVLDIISICINSIQIKQIIFYSVDDFI